MNVYTISNTLYSTGLSLVMGKLTVLVLKGEDFPQLDPIRSRKNCDSDYVDPYCTVTFAGHKAATPVIDNKNDPDWKTGIDFPFQVSTLIKVLATLIIMLTYLCAN